MKLILRNNWIGAELREIDAFLRENPMDYELAVFQVALENLGGEIGGLFNDLGFNNNALLDDVAEGVLGIQVGLTIHDRLMLLVEDETGLVGEMTEELEN